ncbi:hypothetical protein NIE88_09645 [Sporolactobacillus shoreicorticis]|uniref:Lipoprotein n=1 Tax=Sporolactobacillus shoreicorticis TaxID=1923877 RepID=A0ABW5S8S3_9BACL|nr:hypothetical protein [Sporolactobacillus shoreicorticis]MCO7126038.1 hypothetical protein [Sporolactobacillus shoreicorticis]
MKKVTKFFCFNISLALFVLLLFGCSTTTKNKEAKTPASSENASTSQSEKTTIDTAKSSSVNKEEVSKPTADKSSTAYSKEEKNGALNNTSGNNRDHVLSGYSVEEIEYARVWLELGTNKEPDELNVRHIPAGEPLNPDDSTSASYPEAVTQLAGSRLVDGSVTYSNYGNGTIKVYNVPLRWDGSYPAGEMFYKNIIEHAKIVRIDLGDNNKIIKLISKINTH